jgi:hypothetical protein
MDRNELLLDLHHLGVPSGVPKAILEPMIHLVQTVHLFCVEISTTTKQNETGFHFTMSLRTTIGCAEKDFHACDTFDANRAPIFRLD